MWAKGRYFPVAYSRAKVESVTESVTRLSPVATRTSNRSNTKDTKGREGHEISFVIFVDLRVLRV